MSAKKVKAMKAWAKSKAAKRCVKEVMRKPAAPKPEAPPEVKPAGEEAIT
jgi:hypothetical protein